MLLSNVLRGRFLHVCCMSITVDRSRTCFSSLTAQEVHQREMLLIQEKLDISIRDLESAISGRTAADGLHEIAQVSLRCTDQDLGGLQSTSHFWPAQPLWTSKLDINNWSPPLMKGGDNDEFESNLSDSRHSFSMLLRAALSLEPLLLC